MSGRRRAGSGDRGSARRGALRVGTSGYQYRHWRRRFYPTDLPQRRWLAWYAERFDTVEINNTFYGLPTAETVDHWREAAPRGFRYALKFSRYGSHIKRLKDPEASLPAFLEVAEGLGARLGPILVQLPPRWRADPERLRAFLEAAPRRHRWAVEVRDLDWLRDEVYAVLADHDAALVIHDLIEDHPRVRTASWTYLRYHGTGSRYAGGYSPQKLSAEARRVRRDLDAGRDVYAYFNNDLGGHAVADAATLRRYVTGEDAGEKPGVR